MNRKYNIDKIVCYIYTSNYSLDFVFGFEREIMGFGFSKCNTSSTKDKKSTISDCPSRGMQYTNDFIRNQYPNVSHKSTQELHDALSNDPDNTVILDIREKYEYQTSHIPNALWIQPKLPPKDIATVISNKCGNLDECHIYCYCSVGYRSSIMAQKLSNHGLKNVHNVEGSIFKWVNEGRNVVDNDGNDMQKVHTYNALWGLLLDDKDKRVC